MNLYLTKAAITLTIHSDKTQFLHGNRSSEWSAATHAHTAIHYDSNARWLL